jgi:hypothetical protein
MIETYYAPYPPYHQFLEDCVKPFSFGLAKYFEE